MKESTNLSERFGQNARSIRTTGGATLNEIAVAARNHGLPWHTGRVGDIEAGRVAPRLETVLVLAIALTETTGQPVTVSELFDGTGSVKITDKLTVTANALAAAFSDDKAPGQWSGSDIPSGRQRAAETFHDAAKDVDQVPAYLDDISIDLQETVEQQSGEAERRTAKSLNITGPHLVAVSARLWGRSMSAERDHRAGPDASVKTRGHYTRNLKAELRAEVEAHHGDD